MDPTRSTAHEAFAALEDLARIAVSSERRLQRLERMFRWTAGLFLLTLGLALYALSQALMVAPAQAQLLTQGPIPAPLQGQRAWPHGPPVLGPPSMPAAPTAEAPPGPVALFRDRIEALRHHAGQAALDAVDPGHALAVILMDVHDVMQETRGLLAVMPQMGEDLRFIAGTMESMDRKMTGVPVMADEMRRLNANIDVMTTSIDSTMGRMGRMMPYVW